MAPQVSPMQQYMADYGSRLQALLTGQMTPQAARMASPVPYQSQVQREPIQSAFDRPQQPPTQAAPAQPPAEVAAGGGGDEAGVSFKNQWDQSSGEQKKQFTDKLEAQLQRGNQTIDKAYDDLVKQMGTRPASEEKLSREEKGMLLMQFGLSLMANSSSKAYGNDLGAAIGASGSSALEGHLARRRGAQDKFDDTKLAVENNRAQSKVRFAEQSALEANRDEREMARDARREAREDSQIQSTFSGPDDTAYGVTRSGAVSALKTADGKVVKKKPTATGGGAGGRTTAEERRYQMYMDTYAKDGTGKPLEGAQLEAVKKRALAFSADPKASTLSDSELRLMAERSVDAFMKSNWSMFRDMNPDQAAAWKVKSIEDNLKRMREGREEDMQLPTSPMSAFEKPRPGRGSTPKGPKKTDFMSMEEAQAAIEKNELEEGDVITINGKKFRAQRKQ